MPLFIINNQYNIEPFNNLRVIVLEDSGLAEVNTSDPNILQITYSESPSFIGDVGSDTVNTLANQTPSTVCVIAVDSTYVLPNGYPITSFAGFTSCPDETGTITIYYDVSQCGGTGYWVYDINGNETGQPNHLILFHELAHAWHFVMGFDHCANGQPDDPGGYELEALSYENALRDELNL